ncbi:glutamine--fructose-6-phosphate transaminase (isomerizing) [Helicobacter sp. MIT 14-3879]|uniref:glutamine--fructose-6-phosphate transaminase (isomerizing) n=1 Tax=Helicobacter sp. MIT 14-3879 TaxID=2040649 RepID=UPI000E1F567A|nr:glutamine--fructose-6-phosphate transaminase (isomerizing) [Helicobacter sp. MIT 14-3879]RDU62254.1 glutamine--fructose-6-phosphate transaminase (isomerizing) [Helicobacter sp. MIT 14-3879]
MCGIIGYIGNKEKKQIIIDGLRELEYRGYDSAGMAVLNNDGLTIFKTTGKLKNLESKCKDFSSSGFGVAIGHTRWATHGKVSEVNSHPISAEFSTIVHNGIIENYIEIKQDLEKKGHIFLSQTDTEVVVHLFEDILLSTKDVFSAFKKTIEVIKGSYAILLITKKDKEKIFYAKNSSPLLIGSDGAGIYFASSSTPLIGIVNEVCYLEDNDVGYIDINNFKSLKNIQPITNTKLLSQKDGYRYFMEKEIYEQHKVLQDTIAGRIFDDDIRLELPEDFLDGINLITLCACGTSHNASLSAKYLFEREVKIKTNVVIASEFRYSNPVMQKDELFVVISQSGETADTLEALKLANRHNLKTLAICNIEDSSIVREAKYSLLTRAGIERGVASTKAFATQVMLLWMFGIYIAINKKTISQDEVKRHIVDMRNSINATKISPKIHDRLKKLSKRYLHGHGFFFIGRDIFYPLALEGALKLKEVSYLHAEGYPGGEMKHGPIALADSELFTISLMPKKILYDKIKNNTEELSTRDATICVISSEVIELADDMVLIDNFNSYMEEFFSMMVILQILALEVAIRLGNDVDMPRNLAKSVTVE